VEYGWLIRYMHSTGASMFFCGCLLAHVPGDDVRFISKTAGTPVVGGDVHIFRSHEFGFHGLYSAMGTNVILGSAGDCEYVWCDTGYRRYAPAMAIG